MEIEPEIINEIVVNDDFDDKQKLFIDLFGPTVPFAFLPDSGTKLFTMVKDYTPWIDNILKYLSKAINPKNSIYLMFCIEHEHGITKPVLTKFNKGRMTEIKTPPVLHDGDLFYIELDQKSFGHFAAVKYTKNTIYIYDSMSYTIEHGYAKKIPSYILSLF